MIAIFLALEGAMVDTIITVIIGIKGAGAGKDRERSGDISPIWTERHAFRGVTPEWYYIYRANLFSHAG